MDDFKFIEFNDGSDTVMLANDTAMMRVSRERTVGVFGQGISKPLTVKTNGLFYVPSEHIKAVKAAIKSGGLAAVAELPLWFDQDGKACNAREAATAWGETFEPSFHIRYAVLSQAMRNGKFVRGYSLLKRKNDDGTFSQAMCNGEPLCKSSNFSWLQVVSDTLPDGVTYVAEGVAEGVAALKPVSGLPD